MLLLCDDIVVMVFAKLFGRLGSTRRIYMYKWVTDKEFLKRAYSDCADTMNQLVQELKKDNIYSDINVIGSKTRNIITQN